MFLDRLNADWDRIWANLNEPQQEALRSLLAALREIADLQLARDQELLFGVVVENAIRLFPPANAILEEPNSLADNWRATGSPVDAVPSTAPAKALINHDDILRGLDQMLDSSKPPKNPSSSQSGHTKGGSSEDAVNT